MNKLTVVAVVVAMCVAGAGVEAAIVAQTGFNDAAGINPADYVDGTTMIGKGAGEPGWTNNWTVGYAGQEGYFTTTSSPIVEGDLSAKINTASGSSTVIAYRTFAPQTGVFYLDTMVQSPTSLSNGDVAFILYTQQHGGGVASMMNLGAGATSGNVKASDQTTEGNYTFIDTGYDWAAGQWVRWTQEIDVPNKTYRTWVNGHPFDPAPANPLNFRHSSVSQVNRVQLFHWEQSNSASSVRVDQLRILNHNPLNDPIVTGFEAHEGYTDGATVVGVPDAQLGWNSPWKINSGRNGGTAIAQSAVKFSGDMALKMTSHTSPDMMIEREYMPQYGFFWLDFDVMIEEGLSNGLHVYAGHDTGIGFNIAFQSNHNVEARDVGSLEDTGINWTAGEWMHVSAAIDAVSQTYDLYLDGTWVPHAAGDPFNFRGNPTHVDDIRFLLLNQGTSSRGIYIDNVRVSVPEPTTMFLLGSGIALVARRRRRRS